MDFDLRKANQVFHDSESGRYDKKWGIRYDVENADRLKRKFEKAIGGPFPHVKKLLEVGCGTGYVGLNLCSYEGLVDELWTCDISQGMVERCRRNADRIGIEIKVKRSELENLAYPDGEFDMVVGHAILHHIPDVRRALEEIHRVLIPGGICVLAGEPTRVGDFFGRIAKGSTSLLVNWYARRGLYFGGVPARLRESSAPGDDDHKLRELEKVVDIHTFQPVVVCKLAREVGFNEARYESEEFLSSFVGWITRTIENTLSEDNLTFRWRYWSYITYQRLNRLDERLYRYFPSSWFYNMLLFLRKPGPKAGLVED